MDRKNLALMLMGAAGAVCTVAVADDVSELPARVPAKTVGWGRPAQGAFGDRANPTVLVYDNATQFGNFGNLYSQYGVTNHVMCQVNFNPGSYGSQYAGDRSFTSAIFGYGLGASLATWDMRFTFYSNSDVVRTGFTAPGAGMINPAASPWEILTVTGFNPDTQCILLVDNTFQVNLDPAIAVPAGTQSFYLDAALVEPGTDGTVPLTSSTLYQDSEVESNVTLTISTNTGATYPTNLGSPITYAQADSGPNVANVGSTSVWYGRDNIDYNGNYTGDPMVWSASGGVHESRYVNTFATAAPNGITGQAIQYTAAFFGPIPAPATPASTSIDVGGFLPDGVVNVNGQLTTAHPMKFYDFHLKNNIDYAHTTFLDIDSENSDNQTVFVLYTPDSLVFDLGEATGNAVASGGQAWQMSFGVARRPGVGTGAQYSGQDGNMAAGHYYMAVGIGGSAFGDGWTFSPAPVASPSNFSINFNGNSQLTFAAPPAVAPNVTALGDVGILNGGNSLSISDPPGTGITQQSGTLTPGSGPASVLWVRFSQTNPIPTTGVSDQTTGNPLRDVTFLDITQPGSYVGGNWNFALYNNNSLLANGTSTSIAGYPFNGAAAPGTSDGPYNCDSSFAQLSYGTAPDRGPAPLDSGLTGVGKDLDNQNGSSLSAGEYYLGMTLGDAHINGSRWGMFSTNSNNLPAIVSLTNDNRGPSATCPADFNGDGGVDDKDFVLFVAWYNDFTNAAGDLNGDGVTDDSDFSIFATAYNNLVCS